MFSIDERRSPREIWKYLLLVVVLCLLAYVRGLPNLFVAEDFSMIAFYSQDFSKVWRLSLTATRIKPLPLYFGWLLYRIFGVAPGGYHLFALALHVLNCMLVFFLGKKLSKDERVGIVASLLFSVYPRHHQPVLWLAANQFVMAATFMLAGILCFYRYLRTRNAWFQVASFLCACLAIGTNEIGVVSLPLLFLTEVISWQSQQRGWRNLLHLETYLKYSPYLIFLIVYMIITFGGDRLFKLNPVSGAQQAASEGWRYETYHLMLGTSQAKDFIAYLTYLVYPQIPLRSLDVGLMTGVLSGLALLFLLFLFVKGQAVVRFAILWMGLTLLPFVLFVPFGNADRYFYIPAIGLSLLGGLLGCRAYDQLAYRSATKTRIITILVLGMYFVSSGVLIQQRINEWHQAGQIAADVVEQTKHLYPSVPAGSQMLFVGLPDQYEQAYVFLGGGIGGAVYLGYREQDFPPKAYQTRDPAAISYLKEAGPVDQPLPRLYVLLYENGVLYDKSDAVDSCEPLRRETWYR